MGPTCSKGRLLKLLTLKVSVALTTSFKQMTNGETIIIILNQQSLIIPRSTIFLGEDLLEKSGLVGNTQLLADFR